MFEMDGIEKMMKFGFRRVLAALLAVLVFAGVNVIGGGVALSEGLTAEEEADSSVAEMDSSEAVITEDEENGVWSYTSTNLKITIHKYVDKKVTKKKKTYDLIYCVADIQASPESPLSVVLTEPTKKKIVGENLVSPDLLEEKYHPIFAMSDDMYGMRLKSNRNYDYKGIVIRNGEILSDKTRNSSKKRSWPNLDMLALFEDGSMKSYISDALTAEELQAMGATQVFSFGPWLISEGEVNPQVYDTGYYYYSYARAAIGMIEPYHYIGIVVQGTNDNQTGKVKWIGATLDWLTDKMKELGCTEALNLDGGGSAVMFFNGKILVSGYVKQEKKNYVPHLRSVGGLITFGLPEQSDNQ